MTAVAHLNALYSAAPIILWVEDGVTRDYLTKVWADPPEIAFLIAGGNSSIQPAVLAAEREGIAHVFGIVDRDFGHTYKANWNDPQTRVFFLPRHETENYMLDAPAVHGCSLHNQGRTLAQINAKLNALASSQPAWLACRAVLTQMRRDLQGDFPGHPTLPAVTTVAQADQYIVTSPWFSQLLPRATKWTTAGQILLELQAVEPAYTAALANGNWATEFSGKEIFRPLRDYVYQDRNSREPDNDFAKSIGEWQEANGQVPADLNQLRSVLRAKAGLPP